MLKNKIKIEKVVFLSAKNWHLIGQNLFMKWTLNRPRFDSLPKFSFTLDEGLNNLDNLDLFVDFKTTLVLMVKRWSKDAHFATAFHS